MHTPDPPVYPIHGAPPGIRLDAPWDDPAWATAATAKVNCVNAPDRASGHTPPTAAQLLYDDEAFFLRFRVDDHYVRVTRSGHQSQVWKDSCVEFFFQPHGAAEYVNLEVNAGGHKLMHRNARDGHGQHRRTPLPDAQLDTVETWHSLPSRVEPERVGDVTWFLAVRIPRPLLAGVWGDVPWGAGTRWRGNFYKCADDTSHPHWLSWQAANTQPFTFHDPSIFGDLFMQ